MSDSKEQKLVVEATDPEISETTSEPSNEEPEMESSLVKALDAYKKLNDSEELTDEKQAEIEKKIKEITEREIVEADITHEPIEIPVEKGKITIGPPTLTRFEKARIMGARALQLSLGAPPFITIPESAGTSLDIAMEELEKRVIPIIIRRVLPNGDYQNIPIDYFQ